MQRCPYCGQLNDDFEDRCIYCGELLYIAVEHDDNQYDRERDNDDDSHRYADRIAQELIDDERRRQEKLKHQRNDLVKDIDDLDDFAKELLRPESNSDITDEEEDFFYKPEESPYEIEQEQKEIPVQDHDNQIKEEQIVQEEDDLSDDLIDEDSFDDNFLIGEEKYASLSREELNLLKDEFRGKIKRNKKLENSLGLRFNNIELDIDDDKIVTISGKVSINKKLDNGKVLQISVICFNKEGNKTEKENTIVEINKLYDLSPFDIEFKPDFFDTSIIIILPEIVDKQFDIKPKQKIATNKPKQKTVSNKPKEKINETVKNKQTHKKHSSNKQKLINNKPKRRQNNVYSTVNSIFIEQMHDIEHKIGMNITNTSIISNSPDKLSIVGEIYIKNPDKYEKIKIAATCYDKNSKIIGTESTFINTKLYLGFDTLNIEIQNIPVEQIERIRLYPTFQ